MARDPSSPITNRDVRRRIRRSLYLAIPFASVIGLTTLLYAAVQQFGAGEPLSSSKMNANFSELDARLKALEGSGGNLVVPAGTIVAFGGEDIPNGWHACDGAELSSAAYPELCTALGVAWGPPSQVNACKLPNLKGQFLRGAHGVGIDPSGDRAVGAVQDSMTSLPKTAFVAGPGGAHSHTYQTTSAEFDNPYNFAGGSFRYGTSTTYTTSSAANHTHPITGGDPETRPANYAVNYIIKL